MANTREGRSLGTRTNALDRDSTVPYTDCMDETSYKSNRNVFSAGHYHVVWCPKYRRKVLEPPIDERLKQLMSEICEEHDAEIEELEVLLDHVQRYGKCRSAVGDPSTAEAGQGTLLPARAPGISRAQTAAAVVVDELVFLCDHWGRPLSVIKQYLEQQKHV
jgi:putative transposase